MAVVLYYFTGNSPPWSAHEHDQATDIIRLADSPQPIRSRAIEAFHTATKAVVGVSESCQARGPHTGREGLGRKRCGRLRSGQARREESQAFASRRQAHA